MSHAKANTDLQLPSQSKHGVIMKTSAFHDPDTKQVSWCIANRNLSGNWQILECKTEILGGDDPYIETAPYKGGTILDYGRTIDILVDYESVRKNSGMLDLAADYSTVSDIPHYKEVAHADGIIFDVDGKPHPTLQGHIVTKGKFLSSETKAVLAAVKEDDKDQSGKLKSLSRYFVQASVPAQEVLNNHAQSEELESMTQFICGLINEMGNIKNQTSLYYDYSPKGLVRNLYLSSNLSVLIKNNKDRSYGSMFSWSETDKNFSATLKSVESNSFFSAEMKEEIKDYLHHLRLAISLQIINAFCADNKKDMLYNYNYSARRDEIADRKAIQQFVLNHERILMDSELKRCTPSMSKKNRTVFLDGLCAIAVSSECRNKIQEISDVGYALVQKIREVATVSRQRALPKPSPAKP